MFENIKNIQPYFFSLREINKNFSLDIKIPAGWRYKDLIEHEVEIKIQDTSEKSILLSLVSTNTKVGFNLVFLSANTIIKLNREEEEKYKLFNDKVEELKKMFLNSTLDNLKDITFIKSNNESGKDETRINLATETIDEGSGSHEQE